jgi:hypothetical protein
MAFKMPIYEHLLPAAKFLAGFSGLTYGLDTLLALRNRIGHDPRASYARLL